jgi:hypothetical protein
MPIVIQIPTAEEIRGAHNSAEVRDLDDLLAELENAGRQVEAAVSCALTHAIDESAWAHDGHRSAIGWVTSTMGVSRSRAIARVRAARFTGLTYISGPRRCLQPNSVWSRLGPWPKSALILGFADTSPAANRCC